MNWTLIPSIPQQSAKERYLDDLEAWRNFAQRITKNPFVKEFLLERDGAKCGWCKETIWHTSQIHHSCYDHICTYGLTIRISQPTEKNLHKTRLVPDCQSCKKENEVRFSACMSKLTLVHGLCNKEIAQTHPEHAKETIVCS